jgi:diguanylate cyclase (GGDEF)-like protein
MAATATTYSPQARRWSIAFSAVAVAIAVVIASVQLGDTRAAATHGAFWLMSGLAVLAGVQAFMEAPTPGRAPTIICPGICFTFAILLCWGLGPAIAAQLVAISAAQWRLRRPFGEAVLITAGYVCAFGAASLVLWIGQPDPLQRNGPTNIYIDALAVVGAAAAWLATYGLVTGLGLRLLRRASRTPQNISSVGNQMLFKASLLLLAPVLAIAAHISIGFVPLVFVPLYAVQRMARLSAERDRAARMDPLTDLANRTGLKAVYTDLVEPNGREADPARRTTLFMLDLDRFKHVNDALGHDVGDLLLVAVSRRIAKVQPVGATAARLGGDEFAVLASTKDSDEAQRIGTALVRTLAEPVMLEGLRIDATASVGIAVHTDEDEDFATLMRHADAAMYEAKKRGDSVAQHVAGTNADGPERLSLLGDLRDALESDDHDQIAMHYQPQVSLDSGQVEGVEALLRWWHPEHGPIDAQQVLDVVEHTSVMQALTLRVIDDVVAQLDRWARRGLTMRASLNISARDLYSDDLVPHLSGQLARHGVRPAQIQIEITESALLADPSRAQATVARIAALGVAVSLDDFGTGYSSLQHLRKLPIAEIKIDRSFVAGMADNHDDAAIVRSTVGMARSLGIRVVAEGVENQYTRQLLAEAGCDLAQGWFTARPMPGADLTGWLAERPTQRPAQRPTPVSPAPFAVPGSLPLGSFPAE